MGKIQCIAFSVLVLLACSRDESPRGDLDPNVPPTTEGTWYRPNETTTWQWQLSGTVNTTYGVTVYDIDLFESDLSLLALLTLGGRKVVCYFSAGSFEDWRADAGDFLDTDQGKSLDGWEGEAWLDIRSANVQQVMEHRLDVAVQKGCDGVEPDNMDGYANDTGFDLTADDQLAYNRFIANEAHARGLAVGHSRSWSRVWRLTARLRARRAFQRRRSPRLAACSWRLIVGRTCSLNSRWTRRSGAVRSWPTSTVSPPPRARAGRTRARAPPLRCG